MDYEFLIFLVTVVIFLTVQFIITHLNIERENELIDALRWYAEERRYDSTPGITDIQSWEPPDVYKDRGELARETIARLEERHRDTSKSRSARHPDETDG